MILSRRRHVTFTHSSTLDADKHDGPGFEWSALVLAYDVTTVATALLTERGAGFEVQVHGMRRITTFRSTTERIYDGGPIILQYNIIIPLCYSCLQYSVQ